MRVTLEIPPDELAKLVTPALAEPRIPLQGVTWEQYVLYAQPSHSCHC